MRRRGWYVLLLLPFIGTLIPPFYNHASPALFGMPFFYWYQLAWVLVTAGPSRNRRADDQRRACLARR